MTQDKDRAAFEAQIELPSWHEAERNCLRNNETPLDRFIFDNEPSECDHVWRDQLEAVIADAIAHDRQQRGEPLAWIHEDELPTGYPYDAMFPYSKVDGVRMFPVYAPQPAEPVSNGVVTAAAYDRLQALADSQAEKLLAIEDLQAAEPVKQGSQWDKDKWEHQVASRCLDRMGVPTQDHEDFLTLWGRIVAALKAQGLVIEQPLTGPYTVRPAEPVEGPSVDVDALAQEIRRVDGNHSLGAAALAEALMPFLARCQGEHPVVTAEPVKFNPAKGSADTALQMAAIIALRDTQKAEPVKGPSPGDCLRWALRDCGVKQDDNGAYFSEAALGKLASLLARYQGAQPAASVEPAGYFYQWELERSLRLYPNGFPGAVAVCTAPVAAQPSVPGNLWQQAYDKAWSVAHLYHTGAGMLYWLESEHKRLVATTPPAAGQAQQDADKADPVSEMVHAMFRSANSVPVDRVTITREHYDAARAQEEACDHSEHVRPADGVCIECGDVVAQQPTLPVTEQEEAEWKRMEERL